MDKDGTWKLAPAYDLCYSYSPSGQWTNKHQMSVYGKRDDFSIQDLVKVGEDQGIRNPKYIVENIISAVSNWPTYASANDVNPAFKMQIGEHLRINIS
ncbi:MAG: hypothetical protein IPJ13_23420 [Saprospiraceae bacterium]|nr:hypothetical protein [Saprospiraceae bacterium]